MRAETVSVRRIKQIVERALDEQWKYEERGLMHGRQNREGEEEEEEEVVVYRDVSKGVERLIVESEHRAD